jgi:hypothetical protein
VLAGADLGQGTAGRFPAGGPTDRQRDFAADADDVADGQFPGKFSRVVEPPPCGGIWIAL